MGEISLKTRTSEAASLELLVGQLQGHPGVEHGRPQFAPHAVIGEAEDLGGKLSGGFWGEDGGAAETWRRRRRRSGQERRIHASKGSAALTTGHAERGPDVLRAPVWGDRGAVDDGIGRVSGHHRAEAVTSASHSHKNGGNAVTWRGKNRKYIFIYTHKPAGPPFTQQRTSARLRIRL